MSTKNDVQLQAGLDVTDVTRGTDKIKTSMHDMAGAVKADGDAAAKGVSGIGDGADKAAKKLEQADKQIIASIQRRTAAVEAAGKGEVAYQEALLKNRGRDPEAFRPYLDQLRQAEVAQRAASGSLDKMGISAKQTQAALRGVPAQFTDIVTALQGGQAPLTVFLQQGGQLKDMFGGAGNAARALGGYVLGLINPFTVAAAATGLLAAAWFKGSSEQSAYGRAVVLTGQAAGVTAGQLGEMAAAVGRVGTGTQGRAAEVLTQMAQAGGIGAVNLERFTAAALRLEQVGGPAADQTAKAFSELSREPLKAALKLNEATNFLTESTYRQIKALDDQGRTVDAARLAQEAYAAALEDRAPALLQTLGTVERAWLAIKGATKGAVDSVLEIGRGSNLEDAIKRQQAEVTRLRAVANNTGVIGPRETFKDLLGIESFKDQADAAERVLNQLKAALTTQRALAVSTGERTQQLKQLAEYERDGAQLSDRIARRDQEILKEAIRGRELVNAGLLTEESLRRRLLAISEKYAEKPAARGRAGDAFSAERDAAKDWAKAYEQFSAALATAENETADLTRAQGLLLQFLQSPGYLQMGEPARQLALQQAYAAISAEQLGAATKSAAQTADEASKSYGKWLAEISKSADSAGQQVERMELEARATGLVVAGYRSLAQAIQEVEISRLREQQAGMLGDESAVLAIQREIDARQKLINLIGGKESRDAAEKSAKEAADEWKRASEKINDTLTDALMRGFESGKDFARNLRDTVVNMFKSMVLRPVISAIVNPVSQAITGSLGLSNLAQAGTAAAGGVSGGLGGIGAAAGLAGSVGAFGTAAGYGLSAAFGGTAMTALSGGASMIGAGSVASGAGMMLGAAAPYLLAAIVVYNALIKNKDAKLGFGAATIGADGSTPQAGRQFAFGRGEDIGRQDALQIVAESIGSSIAAQAAALGGSAQGIAVQAASDADRKGKVSGTIQVLMNDQRVGGVQTGGTNPLATAATKLGSAEEVSRFFSESTSAAIIAGLQASDLPARFEAYFAGIDAFALDQAKAETILATATGVQNLTDSLQPLGGVFSQLSGLGIQATVEMAALAGGLDAFVAKTQSYISQFYSRDEIAGLKAREVRGALSDAGLSADITTREQFRALVDSLDLQNVKGQEQLATLLNVSSSFAELADYIAETGTTLSRVADQAPASGLVNSLTAPVTVDNTEQVFAINGVETAVDRVGGLIGQLIDLVRTSKSAGFSLEVARP